MPGTSPIRLGSAVSGWTFEAASSLEESASGIQTCTVSALWFDGSTVLSNLPAAGASASAITSYIPSTFLLDYSDAGPGVDFIEGTVARVKLKFKRQNPNRSGETASRQVFTDTVINYKSLLNFISYSLATGQPQDGIFGFPEPVCTVKYNTATEPSITDGLYALPGSSRAAGFPNVPIINIPASYLLPAGSVISYYNSTTNAASFTSVTVRVETRMNFTQDFKPNANGWQLTKIKSDPVANRSFFDVEESWRNFYFFTGVTFVGSVPPLPLPP